MTPPAEVSREDVREVWGSINGIKDDVSDLSEGLATHIAECKIFRQQNVETNQLVKSMHAWMLYGGGVAATLIFLLNLYIAFRG